MKRSTLLLLALVLGALVGVGGRVLAGPLLAVSPGSASGAARPEVLVVRVTFRDTAERDRLATQWGAAEADTRGGYLTVWADRPTYNRMLAAGLRMTIDQETTRQANNPALFGQNSPDTFDGGYKTVEEMQAFLDQKVAAHPQLAVKVDIGPGWCNSHPGQCTQPAPAYGYDQYALHITNQAITGPKPVYWYEAGIHAREIAVPEVAMRYISWLLDGYDSDPDAHWLVDYHDIWVMPMVNPDGHHIVEAGGGSPYYQRKNANNTNGCTTYPPSVSVQFGTDNNRNFSFLWNCCGGSSAAACDQTYHGPSAGSDPETQNVMTKVRQLIPDQRGPNITDAAPLTTTGVFQDMHSNAALNLFPWGFQTTPHAPNDAELRNIGAHLAAANASPPGNTYPYGQPPELLYSVDGDTVDWAYGELGAAAYTTEVGGSSFFPPYATIDSSLWPQNRGALIYQAKIARTPYLLAHGPDTSNVATVPMTVTQGTPAQLTATINFAWSNNTFSQNVGAAEYYVDIPPWVGGATALPMTGTFTAPSVPVQATIDTTGLAPGRHLIFVRGRGVNNIGGSPTWGPVSAAWLWVLAAPGTVTPTVTRTVTRTPVAPTSTRTAILPTSTPTCVPVLNGHLTYQGLAQPSASNVQTVTLQLQPSGGGAVTVFTTTTDLNGNFSVVLGGLAPGAYTYWLKSPRYLAGSGALTLSGACAVSQEFGAQRAGDIDNTNCVDITDFSLLRATFAKGCADPGYDARADYNGDCLVDVTDFSLLRANFGICGPPALTLNRP